MLDLSLISQLPGLYAIKDLDSKYLKMSNQVAKLVGWKSAEQCYEKSDHDLPCKAAERAEEFVNLDHMVMSSNQRMRTLEIQEYSSSWNILIGERIPLRNKSGECEGIYTSGIDVSDTVFFKAYLRLNELDSKLHKSKLKSISYNLSNHYQAFTLSKQQENCIFLLIRGKSVNDIAKILCLSPRTIQTHLEAVKVKLNCPNKAAVIEKAINLGFLHYVPTQFQHAGSLDKIF